MVLPRYLGVLALSIVLALVVPTGAADHGATAIDHSALIEAVLGPGEHTEWNVTFQGGTPLEAGWILIVSARFDGTSAGPAHMTVIQDGVEFASWDITVDAEVHYLATEVPDNGYVELVIENPSTTGLLEATVEFDYTCQCLGKGILMEQGVVVFQADLLKGETYRFIYSEFGEMESRAWTAIPGEPISWETMKTVQEGVRTGSEVVLKGTAAEDARYLFLVQAVTGTGGLTPLLFIEDPIEETPLPAWIVPLTLVVMAGAGMLLVGRRGR